MTAHVLEYLLRLLLGAPSLEQPKLEGVVEAPFTAAQIESLNEYQLCPIFRPVTCEEGRLMIATPIGWRCPSCQHREYCAYDYMANWGWLKAAKAMEKQLGRRREWQRSMQSRMASQLSL